MWLPWVRGVAEIVLLETVAAIVPVIPDVRYVRVPAPA
jgi:hypothetical protein